MKIRRILRPGQAGTKRLVERYGDNLVCVRYRYDDEKKTMFKTIEIIIDNKPWQADRKKIAPEEIMNIRIAIDEVEARNRVKKAGGKWDPKRRVWQLPYGKVIELGLSERIIDVGRL